MEKVSDVLRRLADWLDKDWNKNIKNVIKELKDLIAFLERTNL